MTLKSEMDVNFLSWDSISINGIQFPKMTETRFLRGHFNIRFAFKRNKKCCVYMCQQIWF